MRFNSFVLGLGIVGIFIGIAAIITGYKKGVKGGFSVKDLLFDKNHKRPMSRGQLVGQGVFTIIISIMLILAAFYSPLAGS